MQTIKKIIIYSVSTLLLIGISACSSDGSNVNFKKIRVADKKIKVEIADTQELMIKGLSSRENLPWDQGMLFVYDNYTKPSYWMKDMRFPIDIIWIKDKKIIGITNNIQAPASLTSSLSTYSPSQVINYVLEVNAGWCDENNIKTVIINFII